MGLKPIKITPLKCERCGHEWYPRLIGKSPVRCPHCWNKRAYAKGPKK